MSFIYTRKSMGPRTEPWGTPNVTSIGDERTPFKVPCCDRPERNVVNQVRMFPTTP